MTERQLSRDDVLALLTEVGSELRTRRVEASIYIVGGAAIAIAHDGRRVTRDVDVAVRAERDDLTEVARVVADRHGLSPHWLSSAATAFMSNEPDVDAAELTIPGLRVAVASPEHLIAMKLRSFRERDLDDLDLLFRAAGIATPEEAADIHDRLFDDSSIGHLDRDEVIYSAKVVFDRAEAAGRPITGRLEPLDSADTSNRRGTWVPLHSRNGRNVKGHWRKR